MSQFAYQLTIGSTWTFMLLGVIFLFILVSLQIMTGIGLMILAVILSYFLFHGDPNLQEALIHYFDVVATAEELHTLGVARGP